MVNVYVKFIQPKLHCPVPRSTNWEIGMSKTTLFTLCNIYIIVTLYFFSFSLSLFLFFLSHFFSFSFSLFHFFIFSLFLFFIVWRSLGLKVFRSRSICLFYFFPGWTNLRMNKQTNIKNNKKVDRCLLLETLPPAHFKYCFFT